MKITLALSGGGFRATVFHLGVLARLAREDRLQEVILLSTVSGGSLCAGLVFSLNGFLWPNSHTYLEQVEPQAPPSRSTDMVPSVHGCYETCPTIPSLLKRHAPCRQR